MIDLGSAGASMDVSAVEELRSGAARQQAVTPRRPIAQIAAETGLSEDDIALASYLLALGQAGRTMSEAAAVAGLMMDRAREIAEQWRIHFADFVPAGADDAAGALA